MGILGGLSKVWSLIQILWKAFEKSILKATINKFDIIFKLEVN